MFTAVYAHIFSFMCFTLYFGFTRSCSTKQSDYFYNKTLEAFDIRDNENEIIRNSINEFTLKDTIVILKTLMSRKEIDQIQNKEKKMAVHKHRHLFSYKSHFNKYGSEIKEQVYFTQNIFGYYLKITTEHCLRDQLLSIRKFNTFFQHCFQSQMNYNSNNSTSSSLCSLKIFDQKEMEKQIIIEFHGLKIFGANLTFNNFQVFYSGRLCVLSGIEIYDLTHQYLGTYCGHFPPWTLYSFHSYFKIKLYNYISMHINMFMSFQVKKPNYLETPYFNYLVYI